MKDNFNVGIYGNNVILIPYRREHVEKYHGWMQNEELLDQTASEKLTLMQEYDMQQKWYLDEDKCTFIILTRSLWKSTKCEIDSMVGDVNLFIKENKTEAEIEIMVAEKSARRQGIGKESIVAMLLYGYKYLGIRKFYAIIGNKNKDSLNLFSKLGFLKIKETEVFNESTYELNLKNETFESKFDSETNCIKFGSYPVSEN